MSWIQASPGHRLAFGLCLLAAAAVYLTGCSEAELAIHTAKEIKEARSEPAVTAPSGFQLVPPSVE